MSGLKKTACFKSHEYGTFGFFSLSPRETVVVESSDSGVKERLTMAGRVAGIEAWKAVVAAKRARRSERRNMVSFG